MWELAILPWRLPYWAPLRLDASLAMSPNVLLRWMEHGTCRLH